MSVDYRFDPFTNQDQSVLTVGEEITVPAGTPYYVPLLEVPREEAPSTVLVRTTGSSSSAVPDQNCWTQSGSTTTNNHTGPTAYVGKDYVLAGGELRRAFLHWDIDSMPAVADSAIVRLNINIVYNTVAVGLHKVTSSWVETGPTWGASPTYDPVPAGSFSIVRDFKGEIISGWHDVDITGLYNFWKATGPNHGVMVKADESVADSIFGFNTRAAPGIEPQLVVVSEGNLYTEVASTITPVAGQYAIHYPSGLLRFHSSAAEAQLAVDYRATGSPISAAHTTFWADLTTGTGTAFAVSIPAVWRLVKGTRVECKLHTSCGDAATLALNTFGAFPIKRLGADLSSSQLVSSVVYTFVFDGSFWHVQGF